MFINNKNNKNDNIRNWFIGISTLLNEYIKSSFRRTRSLFGKNRNDGNIEDNRVRNVEFHLNHTESIDNTETLNRADVVNVSVRTAKSVRVHQKPLLGTENDIIFPQLKNLTTPSNCPLIRYISTEKRTKDSKTTLDSFEKKRISKQVIGLGHHAKEQLFCPLQASQIEFAFKSTTKTDLILKIQAPNGETSGYINPKTREYTSFTPSNIGCGHGTWYIHIAVRKGCRFHHELTKKINLVGQGILFFEIDNHLRIQEVEKLWLDCLN